MTTPIGAQSPRPLQTPKPSTPAKTNAGARPQTLSPSKPLPQPVDVFKPATSTPAPATGNKPSSVISSLKNQLNGMVNSSGGKKVIGGGGGIAAVLGVASGIKGIKDINNSGEQDKLGIASGALGISSGVLGLTGLGASLVQHFKGGGKTTGQAAATAGKVASSAGAIAGKSAGRFIPGVNIGIAALDISNAGVTLANKNASASAKATSVITAVGSAAAATNIPIVSQLGAGVSAVSSIIGAALGFANK